MDEQEKKSAWERALEQVAAGREPDVNEEDLLDDAARVILECGRGSTSLLQRKLRLGYAKAARIIDRLEELGLIGPFEAATHRPVYLTEAGWDAVCKRHHIKQSEKKAETPKIRKGCEELLGVAAGIILESGAVSASFLQRNLGFSFSEAVYILDRLEGLGLIGRVGESKCRSVLLTVEQWNEICHREGIQPTWIPPENR